MHGNSAVEVMVAELEEVERSGRGGLAWKGEVFWLSRHDEPWREGRMDTFGHKY
jgi:hypothetical protein